MFANKRGVLTPHVWQSCPPYAVLSTIITERGRYLAVYEPLYRKGFSDVYHWIDLRQDAVIIDEGEDE